MNFIYRTELVYEENFVHTIPFQFITGKEKCEIKLI